MNKLKEINKAKEFYEKEDVENKDVYDTDDIDAWLFGKNDMINFAKAYHQSCLKEVREEDKEIMEFLKMILNSYKVINNNADYRVMHHRITQQAGVIHNKLIKNTK
jgi:hypothetical protein